MCFISLENISLGEREKRSNHGSLSHDVGERTGLAITSKMVACDLRE